MGTAAQCLIRSDGVDSISITLMSVIGWAVLAVLLLMISSPST